jgi:hypothetical protein
MLPVGLWAGRKSAKKPKTATNAVEMDEYFIVSSN